ncbi:hypothetical protein B0H34DRAFT_800853 [Crassisporium funariophilum]|nr:hypothetical protein B0H34DRAFT_800853 [Crassisporium funariophilum]
MSHDRQKTAKESKGFRNRLKNLIGRRSHSTPQSRLNSPSTFVPEPVLAGLQSPSTPKSRSNSPSTVVLEPVLAGLQSPSTPQSRSNSHSTVVLEPVLAGLQSCSTPQSRSNSSSTVPVLATDRKLLAKYTRFRILVIGRANAGKTTLLNRVCNTTEEPSIYDEDKNLLEPTSERGIHDVRRSFVFKSNPGFIFHDSPGFEAGGEEELKAVMTFIQMSSKAKNVDNQIHVIWCVSMAFFWCGSGDEAHRFCFNPDVARPLLPLEEKFFNEGRSWNVPVVAIFMKFDDLIKQVYIRGQDKTENTKKALVTLEKKFKEPLSRYKFPPRAYVRFMAIHKHNGNHQEQVGELIKQTAASIDNLALKMLFVTVQQNNLEVCIQYAVEK